MLESAPFALIVGTLLGFMSGLGTGGGSLLILWLTVVLHTPVTQARLINLMFFLPSACIACLFRWKHGHISLKKVLPAMIAGSTASGIFTFVGQQIDTEILKKLFGILLLFTGIRELLYRPKSNK